MEEYINDKEYFDKNLNISYVDETLPLPDNKLITKHYLSSLILYGFAVLLLQFNPFFHKFSTDITRTIVFFYYILYAAVAPFIYFIFRPKSLYASHNIQILNYIKRIFLKAPKIKNPTPNEIKNEFDFFKPTYLEAQSLMLFFIKVFFGFIILYWFTSNIKFFIKAMPHIKTVTEAFFGQYDFWFVLSKYKNFLYRYIITILLTIDLGFFLFGYFTESCLFKNKIKTTDTSFSGIFFCLICYPPFSDATTQILGWNETLKFPHGAPYTFVWILKIISLFFITIYVFASIALFTKCSNLTNRGIVSIFPYNIVRHPAYISKNMFWFLNTIPVLLASYTDLRSFIIKLVLITLSFLFWAGIYYMRAVTEERHLIKDPDYREYIKKVKYRFIPYII